MTTAHSSPETNLGVQQALGTADVIQLFPPKPEGFLFSVDPSVDHDLIQGFEANPVTEVVRGLGTVVLKDVRVTGGRRSGEPVRRHRMYTIEMDGYVNALEITDPVHSDASYGVMSLGGFTEHIECGIRKKMHSHLSYLFSEGRIMSVSSDGIGPNTGHFSWAERSQHGLDAMAERRLKLARVLVGQQPLFAKGVSMGGVIAHRMAEQTIQKPAAEHSVSLQGLIEVVPAIVTPKRILTDMALLFPPKIAFDIVRELATKTSPGELAEIWKLGHDYGLRKQDLVGLGAQVLDLLRGTSDGRLEAVVKELPTVVITGQNDSLAQMKSLRRLQEKYPDNLEIHEVAGRGHGLPLKPTKVISKLARTDLVRNHPVLRPKPVLVTSPSSF